MQQTTFVPPDLDPSDFANLDPLYRELLERDIDSPDSFRGWLADASALDEVVDEFGSRRYIDHTCHTDDAEVEKAYLHYVEHVEPKLKPVYDALRKKYLAAAEKHGDGDPPFAVLTRNWRADVELYRDANVPLQTEETKVSTEYSKIMGAMTVEFRGKTYTLQQLSRFLEETDRATRQEAWELSVNRRLEDRQKIDAIFDKLIALRHQMALNADHPDYRSYIWQGKKRFDYTPDNCLAFGDAIAELVVPLVEEFDRRRAKDLGVDPLRPWDQSVDAKGRPPLKPFDQDDIGQFVSRCRQMFDRVSPVLGEQFATMKMGANLDLASRKGKKPGGYQCSLEKTKQPFIFMNAVGRQADVETLLHEGGHAFHFIESSGHVPLTFVRHAPLEFCEVASMGMELIAADAYDAFYDEADAARAKRDAFEHPIRLLPWIAVIDGFQHWLYTHPQHSRDERTAQWRAIRDRFMSKLVDWSGYGAAADSRWQAQGHLFGAPFYYIEYGIAQLGALQLWQRYREDPDVAVADYRSALALGGTRPLPELFAAAGIRFDFSKATLGPLVAAAREELAKLPE
jgi:oligoendopeptidase F